MRPTFQKVLDLLQSSVLDVKNAVRYSNRKKFLKDSIAREMHLTSTTVWPISQENRTSHATQAQICGADLDKHVSTVEEHLSGGHCSHAQLKMGAQKRIQRRYAERHVLQYVEVYNNKSSSSLLNDAGYAGGVLQRSEDAGDVPATLLETWSRFLSIFPSELSRLRLQCRNRELGTAGLTNFPASGRASG